MRIPPRLSRGGCATGQPDDQFLDLVAGWWTAGLVRVRPVPLGEAEMPGQQGARGDETMLPHAPGQTAGPVQTTPPDPATTDQACRSKLRTQDRDLVTDHEQPAFFAASDRSHSA